MGSQQLSNSGCCFRPRRGRFRRRRHRRRSISRGLGSRPPREAAAVATDRVRNFAALLALPLHSLLLLLTLPPPLWSSLQRLPPQEQTLGVASRSSADHFRPPLPRQATFSGASKHPLRPDRSRLARGRRPAVRGQRCGVETRKGTETPLRASLQARLHRHHRHHHRPHPPHYQHRHHNFPALIHHCSDLGPGAGTSPLSLRSHSRSAYPSVLRH